MILRDNEIDKQQVRELATKKFELVKPGDRQGQHRKQHRRRGPEYDDVVSAVAPDAPDYATARELVLRNLSAMLP